MFIQVDKLKKQPRRIDIDETASAFPVLVELSQQDNITFGDPVRGTLTACWAGDVIEVSGHIATSVETACARCLMPVKSDLSVDLMLCYSSKSEDEIESEEVEIRSEDLGLILYSGLEIDLRPDLAQEIVMAIPQQLLCDQACRGLCPECGMNLNQGQCDCEKPVFHAGLAALKNFQLKQ